jgi:hypothetical protein
MGGAVFVVVILGAMLLALVLRIVADLWTAAAARKVTKTIRDAERRNR